MIELLKNSITEAQNIVLLGHKNPDGDCTGATLAFKQVLDNMGKNAQVILPNAIPENLTWLHKAETIINYDQHPTEVIASLGKADMLIALDFNAFSRLDEMAEHIPSCTTAMIDHHPHPKIESSLLFSDTSVSSTCELLSKLIYEMAFDNYLDKESATALFTGILTDTGRFNHNSSNPQTYHVVADLMSFDIDKEMVIDQVFDSYSENRMRLIGFALNERMEVFPRYRLAIISLSLEDKKRFNYQQGDSEGLVNMPLSIKGIQCSILIQEHDDRVRMSFRSKGDMPVNTIAAEHFNGGGHCNAAGGTSFESLEKTLNKLKELFIR